VDGVCGLSKIAMTLLVRKSLSIELIDAMKKKGNHSSWFLICYSIQFYQGAFSYS
jgi:hypothetical protein